MPINSPSNVTTTLDDLLSYYDEKFIQNVYSVLLCRAADTEGMRYYVNRIRRGRSRVEIIIQIKLSKEGMAQGAIIDGLEKEIKIYHRLRMPFIGTLMRFFGVTQMDGNLIRNINIIDGKIIDINSVINKKFSDLTQTLISINQKIEYNANSINKFCNYSNSKISQVNENSEQEIINPSSNAVTLSNAIYHKAIEENKCQIDNLLFDPSASHAALSTRLDSVILNDPGILRDKAKLIAFYLPQFHRTKENSEWWGPGFTEWTNAAGAKPNFNGHYQPHIPRELGFYDLSNVDIMCEQAELAKTYGIYGFSFYYYWFSGRRILEKPLDNFLASDVDMPFCLCWANENWTRAWDGDEKSVLLEQKYAENDEENFINDILPFLKDPRYIQVDGKPMLLIYRIKQLPDPILSIKKWRAAAVRNGLAGLHIAVVDFYDISDPGEVGADAIVEFPPHKFNGPNNHPDPMPEFTNPSFSGGMVDYKKIIAQSFLRNQPEYTLYRGIIPGWDNTARRQDTPTIIVNNTPELYGKWLSYLRSYSRMAHSGKSDSIIFVNAWNEWGEGCHLEPDLNNGLRFLEETARSTWFDGANESDKIDVKRQQHL